MARVKNGQKNVTKSVIPVCGQTQCPARTNGKADGLPVHPCATMRVQIPLLARELAVQAVRACGLLAQTGDLVLLVGLEIALEPVPVLVRGQFPGLPGEQDRPSGRGGRTPAPLAPQAHALAAESARALSHTDERGGRRPSRSSLRGIASGRIRVSRFS